MESILTHCTCITEPVGIGTRSLRLDDDIPTQKVAVREDELFGKIVVSIKVANLSAAPVSFLLSLPVKDLGGNNLPHSFRAPDAGSASQQATKAVLEVRTVS